MCMKNLDTNVVFFSGADALKDAPENVMNIYGMSKGIPSVSVVSLNDELYGIEALSFMLLVNAIERKEEPYHDEGDTKDNTVFFDETYEILLRLTEPSTGKFVDLDSYEFTPAKEQITLCRKTYSQMISCRFSRVSVAKPHNDNNLCVLKVLVRRGGSDEKRIVQSMHPIRMELPGV